MSKEKLDALRSLLKDNQIDGYLIPKANVHQSEYLGPEDEHLKWFTNFTGSTGFCVVLQEQAALFVDGRYTLQAPLEVDTSSFKIINVMQQSVAAWLDRHISTGCRIGVDPWLLNSNDYDQYQKIMIRKEACLIPLESNLINLLWHDRPKPEMHQIVSHPLSVSGMESREKIEKITQKLKDQSVDLALVNSLESVNWLFNIRGYDLTHVPVVCAFALIGQNAPNILFIDFNKVTPEIRSDLEKNCTLMSYDHLIEVIKAYAQQGLSFLIDPHTIPFKIRDKIETAGGKIVLAQDPTLLIKACKNPVEVEGMQKTHIRDGAALTSFLAWVTEHIAAGQPLDEWQASEKLHTFRAQMPYFRGESFPTISASGPHGAIVHYHALEHTARALQKDDVYLVDSGGHYDDGSTDVTRTIILGEATPEQKERFTRVLKGHIALANLIFPQGTSGGQIDVLARQFLWQAGLDYSHGTGHGVGSVLNIHEGPQGISKRARFVPLQVGMIVSNEPGYYKENHYGIRIESLLNVVAHPMTDAEQPMLRFETLTVVPIDRHLIEISLMSKDELSWLNQYHARVRTLLMPLLDVKVYPWLLKSTAAL
ncbi:MAG: aminopeptidase P family protein [Janthinobacterium lividum]